MTGADVLFVRIRNAEGKYLCGDARGMTFLEDISKALVFDCRRHGIQQQLEHLREAQGILLEPVPVDPKEIHETCDGCGRLLLSFQVFFDGKQYLCSECRRVTGSVPA